MGLSHVTGYGEVELACKVAMQCDEAGTAVWVIVLKLTAALAASPRRADKLLAWSWIPFVCLHLAMAPIRAKLDRAVSKQGVGTTQDLFWRNCGFETASLKSCVQQVVRPAWHQP